MEVSRRPLQEEAKMKVVVAYLLVVLGGNNSPSSEDIKSILGLVGADAIDDKIDSVKSVGW